MLTYGPRIFYTRGPMKNVRNLLAFLLVSLALLPQVSSFADPALRYSVEQRGDFVIFGNTVGYDCHSSAIPPTVGTIGPCGTDASETGIDVLWRSEHPAAGQALADTSITPTTARSTAILKLPAMAEVTYARLYWAAALPSGATPGASVALERPGGFSNTINPDPVRGTTTVTDRGYVYYQSNADVTQLVKTNGTGAYRVSGIPTWDFRNKNEDVVFVAWSIVVFYKSNSESSRNLTLFDGMEYVKTGKSANATLSGFLVPTAGFDAKLGVIGYEGDADLTGDYLKFNGTALSNALNPVNNFFNRSHSFNGMAVSTAGDLPQLTGAPGSFAGFDMDVVDITSLLSSGQTLANIESGTNNDYYFWGAFVTSISTLKPILSETKKSSVNLTRTSGGHMPGDIIEYTITTKNTGNDAAIETFITDSIPIGTSFVPGSLSIVSGAGAGNKTDTVGDDQADYVAAQRKVVFRIGAGANGTVGGKVLTTDPEIKVKFSVRIDTGITGDISNQAKISALGEKAKAAGITTPQTWDSNKDSLYAQCVINTDCPTDAPICKTGTDPNSCIECEKNSDCPSSKPFCDMQSNRCTSSCSSDEDCKSANPGLPVCDTSDPRICVECSQQDKSQCSPSGKGGECLDNKTCGCTSDKDCVGHACDLQSNTCSIVATDFGITSQTGTPARDNSVTYTFNVSNAGPSISYGTILEYKIPDGASVIEAQGAEWVCQSINDALRCVIDRAVGIEALPALHVTIQAQDNAENLSMEASVMPVGTNDPILNNNYTQSSVSFQDAKLAGGGVGCQAGSSSTSTVPGMAALLVLLIIGGLLLKRRELTA